MPRVARIFLVDHDETVLADGAFNAEGSAVLAIATHALALDHHLTASRRRRCSVWLSLASSASSAEAQNMAIRAVTMNCFHPFMSGLYAQDRSFTREVLLLR